MHGHAKQCVLEPVPQLSFGPQSDVFTSALSIALQFVGQEQCAYHSLLGWSGRGFSLCWSDRSFLEDPDELWYLRSDYDSATAAVAAAGFDGPVRPHADCLHAETSRDGPQVDAAELRGVVRHSITRGRPVIVQLSLAAEPWQPEWALVTGYEDDGETVLGWSCFDDELFTLPQWEPLTVAAVSLEGEAAEIDGGQRDRRAVEMGVAAGVGRREPPDSWGVSSYEAWAQAVESIDTGAPDAVLQSAMRYHAHYVGHLAAQRWYTGSFLREAQAPVFTISETLRAAACYARIHELMWDCWQVAGAYWRDESQELAKFRDAAARQRIAVIIRDAGQLEQQALECLQAAVSSWDKTHAAYKHS